MKIQILSDTHNECGNEPFIPVRTDADVVVLAGDIGRTEHSFRWAAEHFAGKRVVMVAGNHEAWDVTQVDDIGKKNLVSGWELE